MTLWRYGLIVTFLLFGASITEVLPNVIFGGRKSPLRHLLMEDDNLNTANTTEKSGEQQETQFLPSTFTARRAFRTFSSN